MTVQRWSTQIASLPNRLRQVQVLELAEASCLAN